VKQAVTKHPEKGMTAGRDWGVPVSNRPVKCSRGTCFTAKLGNHLRPSLPLSLTPHSVAATGLSATHRRAFWAAKRVPDPSVRGKRRCEALPAIPVLRARVCGKPRDRENHSILGQNQLRCQGDVGAGRVTGWALAVVAERRYNRAGVGYIRVQKEIDALPPPPQGNGQRRLA
jgi:hypothetical protein